MWGLAILRCTNSDLIRQLPTFRLGACPIISGLDSFQTRLISHLLMFLSAFCHSTFSLMSTVIVVVVHPFVQIFLQRFVRTIQFLSECHLVELIQYGLVEALADTICLW